MAVTRDTGGRARPSVWVASGLVAVVLAAVLAGRLSVPQAAPRSALIRFELPAPDGAVFRSTVETVHVAVSPDGRTVAFLAGPKGLGSDQSAIWLRSLSDAEPRRLTGSDGAVSLFWSPAGDEIGYFAGGRLKRQMVADDARPPVVLCEVSEGIGLAGTWGRDAIVFGSIQGEYIQRVDLSGGEPEILFAADPARNEYRVQWPWFLSDGVSLLYLSSDGEGQSQLMHLPPGGAPRAVAPVRSRVEAAGEDVLVFAADGVLLAQKFDPLTSRLLATPVPVVPWVANFDATKYASFAASPSGTLVAGSGVDDGYLAWYDRSGRELQRVGEPGSRLTITISDDGRRALSDRYQRVRSSYDIGLVDLDRGIETLLVSTPNTEAFPVWLRGDRAFLYSAARGRPPQLMRRDLDSAAETQLLDDPSFQIPVALLSDGRLLLRRRTHQTGFGLVSISLPTSALPARPEFVEILPAASEVAKVRVSPDEHLLAFLASDSGRQEAYLRFLDNTATAFRVSSSGGSAIGWSSDGSELLFTSSDQRLYAAAIETQPSLRITRTEELFQLPALGWTDFDVAPDGRILAIVESAHARSEPLTVIAGWSIDD